MVTASSVFGLSQQRLVVVSSSPLLVGSLHVHIFVRVVGNLRFLQNLNRPHMADDKRYIFRMSPFTAPPNIQYYNDRRKRIWLIQAAGGFWLSLMNESIAVAAVLIGGEEENLFVYGCGDDDSYRVPIVSDKGTRLASLVCGNLAVDKGRNNKTPNGRERGRACCDWKWYMNNGAVSAGVLRRRP